MTIISPKKSLISIDLARAFAALGVFYYHEHLGAILAKYSGIQLLSLTDSFGAFYAVPLFFLISGYCIHLSNLKYLKEGKPLPVMEYYKRRWLRIYPPYLAALIFSVAVNFIVTGDSSLDWSNICTHIFLLQGFSTNYFASINAVLWTISVEMAFYILYPLFYYLRLKFSLINALFFTLIVTCISIACLSTKDVITHPIQYFVFNLWFAWCCGAYLADKKAFNESDLKKPVYKVFYSLVLVSFIWMNFYAHSNSIINYQVNILVWTAPLLFLLNKEHWLSQHQSFFIKILVAVGLSSYSLYLFHEPLISLNIFLERTYLPVKFHLVGLLAGIFIIPVITWFSYLYIEKPFMSKKRKLVTND